jgi:SPP1 family predicted phage head-tail adaptor
MRGGRLRQRVTILTATATVNSFGEPARGWATAAETTVWAEMTPMMSRARETFAEQAGQEQAVVAWQCRMRYRAGLSVEANRLRWRGRVFEVEAVVDPDGRMRETVVLCHEVLG